MKISMDNTGNLVIEVESIIESYALEHWYDKWSKHTASFIIQHGEHKCNVVPQQEVDYSKKDFRDTPSEDFYNK